MPDTHIRLLQVGNAEIALRQGSATAALAHISDLVDDILADRPNTRHVEHSRHVTLSDVLIASNDPRALDLIGKRRAYILHHSAAITNLEHRNAYLEKATPIRHLLTSYDTLNAQRN